MTVLLVIHIIVVLMLIGVILIQRSSSDGFTGGGGGGDSLFSGKGKANMLTRTTAILATIFIVNSLILAYVSSHATRQESIIDKIETKQVDEPEEEKNEKPLVPIAD